MIEDRIARLRSVLPENDLDALLITQNENRYYLTGFTGSAGVVILTPSQELLVVDFRYWEQAEQEAPRLKIVRQKGRFEDFLPDLLRDHGIRRAGFEAETITVSQHDRWQKTLGADITLIPTTNLVENLRAVKDAQEIAKIQAAVDLTDRAFTHIVERLRPGMTERDIAWDLEVFLRTHGSDGLAFEAIVAAGPNSALPHAHPTGRPVQSGEPILFDFGARVDRYCADFSRTVCLGDPSTKLADIFELVQRAQQTALDGIHGGQPAAEADALARNVIRDAGHEAHFGHGLGHGLGLFVHESPRLHWQSDDELRTGMVVTVEPGVYVPGWGGVRLEDVVVVQVNTATPLTKSPKPLALPQS